MYLYFDQLPFTVTKEHRGPQSLEDMTLCFALIALAAHQPAPAPRSPVRRRSTNHSTSNLSQAPAAATEETGSLLQVLHCTEGLTGN